MRVIRHLRREPGRIPRTVLTLGNFDGVHLGHQAIIGRAVATAREIAGRVVALTFEPHPIAVLAPERAPALIQPMRERLRLLRDLGVDVLVLQRFTRAFAALEPEAFMTDFVLAHLEVAHVVVGHNVSFGRNRAGTVATLRTLGGRYGFAADEVGPVTVDGEVVSSTALRAIVRRGDVASAARLLGRPYTLRGRVVEGDRRGRSLGFPTANLRWRSGLLLPADGVYAVRAMQAGRRLGGVLNIGIRPTFGERRRSVEVHLLDFAGDLYGRWLEVELVASLRPERTFSGPDALARAIAEDIARARAILESAPA
jgi:riboflavin kinase/FMN adenylyltransferase